MITKKTLIKKLKKDIYRLETKIKYINLCNIKNISLYIATKLFILIEDKLPLLLASFIVFNSYTSKNKIPFKRTEITEPNMIEVIDTSTGIHIENKETNYEHAHKVLEHSTAWYVNENGYYERIVTSYQIDLNIFTDNIENILNMTKEEVDSLLMISNVSRVEKSSLIEEDKIYNEEVLVYINCYIDKENPIIRKETMGEEILEDISYIITMTFLSEALKGVKNIIIKDYVKNKLNILEAKYRPINKNELERLNKILELRKENLLLLEGDKEIKENNKKRTRIK